MPSSDRRNPRHLSYTEIECSINSFGHAENIASNVLHKIEVNPGAFYHRREIVLAVGGEKKSQGRRRLAPAAALDGDRISPDLRLFDRVFLSRVAFATAGETFDYSLTDEE